MVAAAIIPGLAGGLAWTIVGLDVIFAAGWGYFAFTRPYEVRATA